MVSAEDQSSGRLRDAIALVAAVAAPTLLAFNWPPSPTLLNQCLAIGLWGATLSCAAFRISSLEPRQLVRDNWALCITLVVIALGTVVALGRSGSPMPIALGALGVLGAAGLVLWFGTAAAHDHEPAGLFAWFLWALVGAGVVSGLIACLQVFTPEWPDGELIARSGLPGRAVGNLRQPNHLSSLLLWSLIGAVGLHELRRLDRRAAVTLSAMFVFGLVLSGSRTGALGCLVLAGWGLLDRRLSRPVRALLLATPLLFALVWVGMSGWSHASERSFGGESRLSLQSGGDISSSRFAIWSNAWVMLGREPLSGVGFGEFNLAWTLSAFPDRPIAFFDHTHNLPLQLAVELGLPLAALIVGLLAIAMVQAWRRAWRSDGDLGVAKRTAFMIVLMIALHSQLEYPLWYAYFLLPTAFAWGFALAGQRGEPTSTPTPRGIQPSRWPVAVGLTMTLGAAAALMDYRGVVVIYAPPDDAAPLDERIARGQRSPLFAHHADYAAATAFGEPKAPLSPSQTLAFRRAPHHLLDVRLMIAWAQALAAQGEVDKARWLAARIREFRNPGSDEFFAPCAQPVGAAQAFQCQAPHRTYNWREFTRT